MARKPQLDVNRREVREEIKRTGGNQIDVDKPSTPTGKKAERIAAKLQGVKRELPENNSHDQKKTVRGTKRRKHSRAA